MMLYMANFRCVYVYKIKQYIYIYVGAAAYAHNGNHWRYCKECLLKIDCVLLSFSAGVVVFSYTQIDFEFCSEHVDVRTTTFADKHTCNGSVGETETCIRFCVSRHCFKSLTAWLPFFQLGHMDAIHIRGYSIYNTLYTCVYGHGMQNMSSLRISSQYIIYKTKHIYENIASNDIRMYAAFRNEIEYDNSSVLN